MRRRGDVVAVQMPTCYETMLTYLAILQAGAILLPIIHIYGAAELQFVLQQSSAKALIIPDRWRKLDFIERWHNAQPLPDLQHLIVFGEGTPVSATPDEKNGEKVCAFVIPRLHRQVSLAELQQHFNALGLAKQKCPEALHLVSDLPRTAGGKVKKFELRQQLRENACITPD